MAKRRISSSIAIGLSPQDRPGWGVRRPAHEPERQLELPPDDAGFGCVIAIERGHLAVAVQ
jgi:hypothetical protein